MTDSYKKQVSLIIRILPLIAKEPDVALHGGTAINLFVKEMPRLSVDIDLTYLPINDRNLSLSNIREILGRVKLNLSRIITGIHISGPDEHSGESKIVCSLKGVNVKVEINTINRGALKKPMIMPLCSSAQKEFGLYAEMPLISFGQSYMVVKFAQLWIVSIQEIFLI
ncbi:MAG: nucleotidyl transferase AbiEii/AbiGii toxin family protein [Bacteroidia bacterium]|nr:nucleotidyl transferase AbiEii/AbiGii toxin family protein [Bacteroidia bacterium]